MDYKRTKNGFKISVKAWSKDVVVVRVADGQSVTTTFGDHIQAVLAAKAV